MSDPESSPEALRFAEDLERALAELPTWTLLNGLVAKDSASVALDRIRTDAAEELDTLRHEVDGQPIGPAREAVARDNTRVIWRVVGRYRELVTRLDQIPFTLAPVPEGSDVAGGCMTDIVIKTREAPIPASAGQLKTDIFSAINVIQAVYEERVRRYAPLFSRYTLKELAQRRSDDLKDLLGIARVGLESAEVSRVDFARNDLRRMTDLYTLREAGAIKNAYVARLLLWCTAATVIFTVLYLAIRFHAIDRFIPAEASSLIYKLRNFDLLAAGTAIGTWLSFSLRRQELAFSDLAVLEPDRLDPSVRVIFMIGLSGLVGLLLFTGAVVAGIGGVQGLESMHAHGAAALTIGLLAGVAERALGNAVARRGQDFATAIGGQGPGTPQAAAKV